MPRVRSPIPDEIRRHEQRLRLGRAENPLPRPTNSIVSVSTVATSGSDVSCSEHQLSPPWVSEGGVAKGPYAAVVLEAERERHQLGRLPARRRRVELRPGRRSAPRTPAPSGGQVRLGLDRRQGQAVRPSLEQRQHAVAAVADDQVVEAARRR